MMVSIDQWCAAIGTFNCHKSVTRCVSFSNNVNSSHFLSVILESNPGPKRLKPNYLSICH